MKRRSTELVTLGDVLRLCIDAVPVDPSATYPMAGVYGFGRGLFTRSPLNGSATTYRVLHRLHAGDLVMSQLKAWEGAIARVTPQCDGSFLSPQFPTFRAVDDRLDSSYLEWYCRQPSIWEVLRRNARGMGARRDSVSPSALLSLQIPLPPLAEQRRIVVRLSKVATRVDEIERLQQQVASGTSNVLASLADRPDLTSAQKLALGWVDATLGDVLHKARSPVRVDVAADYPNVGIYSFGRGLFLKPSISGATTSASTLYRVRAGQFVYSRLFAFEGAYGIVTDEFDGYCVSNEYPTFDLDGDRVGPEFLWAYFQSPRVWSTVAVGSKGLGHRRQRVHPEQLLRHRLMLPPVTWQTRIASIRQRAWAVARLGVEADSAITALLPSALVREVG